MFSLHSLDLGDVVAWCAGHILELADPDAYDPFFTTKKRGEGTGLGLTIVEGIVRNRGGEISLASRAGEGTTVTVRWPQIPKAVRPHPPENRLHRTMA